MARISITLLLSFQLTFCPSILYAGETKPSGSAAGVDLTAPLADTPPADPQGLADEQQKLNQEADVLNGFDGKTPPPADSNPMGPIALLTGQFLDIPQIGGGWQAYSLNRLDLNLPTVVPADFYYDVRVGTDESTGELVLNAIDKKGETLARHRISKIKPLVWARDRELLTVLTTDGILYAIDMGYAKDELFRGPMPLANLLDTDILKDVSPDEIKHMGAGFVSRGLKPFVSVSPHAVQSIDRPMTAGDMVIYVDTPNGRKLLGQFNRSVMKTEMYINEAVISMLAYRVNPNNEAQKALSIILQLHEQSEVAARTAQESSKLDPELRDTLLAIQPEKILALTSRSITNKDALMQDRDKFSLREWQQQYMRLRNEAIHEIKEEKTDRYTRDQMRSSLEDLGDFWPELLTELKNANYWDQQAAIPRVLFQRFMTPNAMKTISNIIGRTLLGATALGAAFGADQLLNSGLVTDYLIHFVNQTYSVYAPNVLKDAMYRVTLLKSMLILSSFVGVSYVIGLLWSMKDNIGHAIKGLATMGMRTWGKLSLAFWHRLATLTKQDNIMTAMRLGVAPLTSVRPTSNIGQQLGLTKTLYPALSNPFASNEARSKKATMNARALELINQQKSRRHALAWTLALLAVSGESEIDPATLTMLAQNGGIQMSAESLQKMAQDPKFIAKWSQVASEIYFEFEKIRNGELLPEFSKIPPGELARDYAVAQFKVKEIQNRGPVWAFVKKMGLRWRMKRENLTPWLGKFTLPEYEFLESAEPSNFVVNQFWRQFVTDYLLAVFQIGLIGPRANLLDPQALAADPNGLAYTNPGHLYEMADQVRIYGLNVPARYSLLFQKAAPVIDHRYDPLEGHTFQDEEGQGFVAATRIWVQNLFNFKRAKYGQVLMRDLRRFISTIQANALVSIASRMLVGHQGFKQALPAFIWTGAWATWGFGWPWIVISRGNQMYEDDINAQAAVVKQARQNISQGLRLDDSQLLQQGIDQMTQLYQGAKRTYMPKELKQNIAELEQYLTRADSGEIESVQIQARMSIEALDELHSALQHGTPESIAAAESRLRNLYISNGVTTVHPALLQRLSGLSLLKFSLEFPPIATQQSVLLNWATQGVGAVSTTWLATSMSVVSFRPGTHWIPILIHYGWLATALYTGSYFGEKLVVAIWDRLTQKPPPPPPPLTEPEPVPPRSCDSMFGAAI